MPIMVLRRNHQAALLVSCCTAVSAFAFAPLSTRSLSTSSISTNIWQSKTPSSTALGIIYDSRKDRRDGEYDDDGEEPTQKELKMERIMEVQAKIDELLNDPNDPLFDTAGEMEKVVDITVGDEVSTENVTEAMKEYARKEAVSLSVGATVKPIKENKALSISEVDRITSNLEGEMHEAIRKQDMATAADRHKHLSELHFEDSAAVLKLHGDFYRAFKTKDIDLMRELWLADPSSICIQPIHKPIVGIHKILENWETVFGATQSSTGQSDGTEHWMEPFNMRLNVRGTTATVTCDQHVYLRRYSRGQKRHVERVNTLVATNIFRKVGDRWYLSYHHAAWHADSPLAKNAMKQPATDRVIVDEESDRTKQHRKLLGHRPQRLSGYMADDDDDDEDDIKENDNPLNGIMGTSEFRPIVSDGPVGKKGEPRVIKKVITGSLSDILNGNLNDILGDIGGADGGNIGDGSIHIQRIGPDGIIDSNNDDDDDDDDEDEYSSFNFVNNINEKMMKPAQFPRSSSPSKHQGDKDAVRKDCIAALRRLAKTGILSAKQKRVLLTDIIKCSARAEYSMVEVAYELLSEDEDDDSDEEFAEQCRVFAESLLVGKSPDGTFDI